MTLHGRRDEMNVVLRSRPRDIRRHAKPGRLKQRHQLPIRIRAMRAVPDIDDAIPDERVVDLQAPRRLLLLVVR